MADNFLQKFFGKIITVWKSLDGFWKWNFVIFEAAQLSTESAIGLMLRAILLVLISSFQRCIICMILRHKVFALIQTALSTYTISDLVVSD